MATLNLKKVGNLVLVEYTGRADRIISASNPTLEFDMPGDGTGVISISLAGRSYPLASITGLQINGVAATDQADSLTKLATVFPDANSGDGGSGLPDQTGNSGKFLKTNGSAASWDTPAGGGAGLVLESYQNSSMSAPVQAYVFRDADDNIVRVCEPLRGNDIQGDNIEDFPFDNVDWEKNTFMAGAILSNVPINSVITGCVLHPKAAIYGGDRRVEITDSFLDSRAAMYILKPNLTVVSAVLSSQSKLAISGTTLDVVVWASSEVGTFGNGGGTDLVSINTVTKTFKILGDVVADVKSIVRILTLGAASVNEGYYTVASKTLNAGNTDVVVTEAIPSSTIGETQIQLISVFGSLSYINLQTSSFLVATTDNVNADTVDIANNIYYPVSTDIEGVTVVNIGGNGYELAVTSGAVTATPV